MEIQLDDYTLPYIHEKLGWFYVLGGPATRLYGYFYGWLDVGKAKVKCVGKFQYIQESRESVAKKLGISLDTLVTAKKKLEDLGLIKCSQSATWDRTLLWSITDKSFREDFNNFCKILYLRINDVCPLKDCYKLYAENIEIIAKFKDHVKDFDKYFSDKEMMAQARQNCANSPSQSTPAKSPSKTLNVKKSLPKKAKTPDTPPKPCRFVEHWNKQPGVPKCRIGTKGYEQARAFFKAHQRYEAGNCSGFMLDKVEQERISLYKINRIPPNTERRGPRKIPMRSDAQMFEHIERAAKVYHPDFWPGDKGKLPKRLVSFLYNAYSKAYGQSSMFLEKLQVRPPQLLAEANGDTLYERASEFEQDTYWKLKEIYDFANGLEGRLDLSPRERRQALAIAGRIYRYYQDNFEDLVGIFQRYGEFLLRYSKIVPDLIWDGMPLAALDVDKKIWNEFIDSIYPG